MDRIGTTLRHVGWPLIGAVALLAVMGVANLQSTSLSSGGIVHESQMWWLGIGAVVMFGVAAIDYRLLRQHAGLIYVGAVVLLALVLVVGKDVNGSRRWIEVGGFGFQPSEVAKLAVIITLAAWFDRVRRPAGYTLRDLAPAAALLALPMLLIIQEPDLGHTVMLAFIAMAMLAFERVKPRAIWTLLGAGAAMIPLAWVFVLRSYQKDRVLTLLDGEADLFGSGWHAWQSKISVGAGELLGKGHGRGTQVAGGFLPENHTDFVFANFSEEHGFVGAALVLLLYFGVVMWGLRVAGRAREPFGGHIGVGVAALFFWQVVMNVGMVLNILPVTGVTLPLMSYGGSSVVTVMAALGLVLNVGLRRTSLRGHLTTGSI